MFFVESFKKLLRLGQILSKNEVKIRVFQCRLNLIRYVGDIPIRFWQNSLLRFQRIFFFFFFIENKLVWCGHHKTFFNEIELQCNIPFWKKVEKSVYPPPALVIHVPYRNYNKLLLKKSRQFQCQKSLIINIRKKSIYYLPDDFWRRF